MGWLWTGFGPCVETGGWRGHWSCRRWSRSMKRDCFDHPWKKEKVIFFCLIYFLLFSPSFCYCYIFCSTSSLNEAQLQDLLFVGGMKREYNIFVLNDNVIPHLRHTTFSCRNHKNNNWPKQVNYQANQKLDMFTLVFDNKP